MIFKKIVDKHYWYLSLFISFISFLSIIYIKHVRFNIDFPLCWDPPGYTAAANYILEKGPLFWMLKNNSFSFLYMVIAFFGFILSNTKVSTIILQTISALLLIYIYSNLALKITDSYWVAAVTAPITLLSTNFIRLYGAPNQSYALFMVCIILVKIDYISDNFKVSNYYSLLLVGAFSAVFWIHSFFTYLPFVLILIVYVIISPNNRSNVVKFISLSTIVGIIPQIPFIFNQILFSTIESSSRTNSSNPSITLYYSYLEKWAGGNAILLVISIVGFFSLINKFKKKRDKFSLITILWIIVLQFLYHITFLFSSFWPFWNVYASRIVLILPTPITLTIGFFTLFTYIEHIFITIIGEHRLARKIKFVFINTNDNRNNIWIVENKNILKFILVLIIMAFSIVTMLPSFNITQNIIWRPFINPVVHENIVFVKKELKSMNIQQVPIYMFYEMPFISPGGIDYRRSIIGIEMGPHYAYYGKLQYILMGLETPPSMLNWNLDKTTIYSHLFWNELNEDNILNNINEHPIVVITPYFYKDVNTMEFIKNYSHGNGVYIIPPKNNVEIPDQVIVCSRDYLYATKGFYLSSCNWSISENTLNYYVSLENYSSQVEVDFPLFLDNGSYIVYLHFFDASTIYYPIKFYIDDSLVHTLFYNGTNNHSWRRFELEYAYNSPASLKVVIEEGTPHYFKFDVIYAYKKSDDI